MDIMLIYPPLTVEERYGRKVGKGVGGNLRRWVSRRWPRMCASAVSSRMSWTAWAST